jgi:hypothetical protein
MQAVKHFIRQLAFEENLKYFSWLARHYPEHISVKLILEVPEILIDNLLQLQASIPELELLILVYPDQISDQIGAYSVVNQNFNECLNILFLLAQLLQFVEEWLANLLEEIAGTFEIVFYKHVVLFENLYLLPSF